MLNLQTLQLQNPWLLHFLTLWPPHLEQSPPRQQALCYSLPSKANWRHCPSPNISVKQHYPSLPSVCTVCVWGGGGGIMQIVHIVMAEPLLMYTLCISCLSNCRWQSLSQSTLCAFVEHFEPQGRHFTNIHDYYYKKEKKKALCAQFKTWLCPICVSQNKQCPFKIACTGRWNIHKPKPKCTKKTIHQQLSNTTAKLRLLVINISKKSQIMRTAPHPHDPAKRSYNTVWPQQSTSDLQAVRSVHITHCRSDNCCSRHPFWTGKYLAVNRRHSLQTCSFIQTPLKLEWMLVLSHNQLKSKLCYHEVCVWGGGEEVNTLWNQKAGCILPTKTKQMSMLL